MTTPEKYRANSRPWESKAWLYEQYWGELRSIYEIAESEGVGNRAIADSMREFGIPRRRPNYRRDNMVSPFRGFYREDENATTDEESRTVYSEDEQYNRDESVEVDWTMAKVKTL